MTPEDEAWRKAYRYNLTRYMLRLPIEGAYKRQWITLYCFFFMSCIGGFMPILLQIIFYSAIQLLMTFGISEGLSIAVTLFQGDSLTLFTPTFWGGMTFGYFINIMYVAQWRKLTILEITLGALKPGKRLDGYSTHASRLAGRLLTQAKASPDLYHSSMAIWLIPSVTISYLIGISIVFVATISLFLWFGDQWLPGQFIDSGRRDLMGVLLANVEYVGDIVLLNIFSAFDFHLSDTKVSSHIWIRLYIFGGYSLHMVNIFELVKEYLKGNTEKEIDDFRKILVSKFELESAL